MLEIVIMVEVSPLGTNDDWTGVEMVEMMMLMMLAVFGWAAMLGEMIALVSVVADAADVD